MFNAKEVKDDCVKWVQRWFKENGDGCNAVIGISGGKDSSVVAALCAEALGNERVIGVMMPMGIQNDIADSEELIAHLNIRSYTVDISGAVSAIQNEILLNHEGRLSQQAIINLPARIRMATLFAVAQSYNGRVSCNCNLSEDWIGYSTFGGDDFGSFAPLRNLTSDEVTAIGDELGLPYHLTHKTPSDGLCGKSDEDNFGFTYAVLNRYIREGVCKDPDVKSRIDELHKRNLFKLKPTPVFFYSQYWWEEIPDDK